MGGKVGHGGLRPGAGRKRQRVVKAFRAAMAVMLARSAPGRVWIDFKIAGNGHA